MNNMEKYLSSFKLKAPPPELRQKIIANAARCWNVRKNIADDLTPGLILAVKIFFPAAAAILIAILLQNFLYFSRPEIGMGKHQAEIKQLVELGISEFQAKMRFAVEKYPERGLTSYKKYLQEDEL
ncbi:MAG: hypothetical protein PHV59_03705 [Victivallales bacterium]|nr:hypothetical protein [Victivallales bacterium]